jgi:hypothetical protein
MADLAAIKNNVRNLIKAEFGSVSENNDGNMFIKNESSVTFVTFDDWNHRDENVGVVEVWAIVALGLPEINKDLAVELTTTLQRRFCCWYFIQRDDGKFNLVLSSSLIGATIDQAELATAVLMVAYNSNDLDDQIVAKYGGSVFAGE